LYIRREGNNSIPDSTAGSSDSIFMDIVELKDGDRTTGVFGSPPNLIADWYEAAGNVDGDFATVPWNTSCQAETNSAGASGLSADWLIPTQGVYTLRFSQREDGAAVDAFVFQLKTLPAPTDDGPAMSSLVQNRMAFETVADTFVKRDNGSDPLHGADTELIIKNDWQTTGTSGLDRNTYLRFDISGLSALEGMTLTNATLEIDLIDEGIGTNHNIYVAVIAEDAMAETFDEYLLSSSISPPSSNDVWSSTSDEAVDFTKVFGGAPVGSFVIHTNDNSKTMKFDAPGLLEAIRADTDGVLSLVLYRTFDSSAGDSFASKEHATLFPPRIDVIYRPRKYGTVIIVM